MSNKSSPTLYILLDSGTGIRNILRSDIFNRLQANPQLQMVIFSPVYDDEFCAEFASTRVRIEPQIVGSANTLQKIARTFRRDLWATLSDCTTYLEKRQRRPLFGLRLKLMRLAAKYYFANDLNKLLNWLEMREKNSADYPEIKILEELPPDLIFCITLYASNPSLELIAEKRKIPQICLVHSWDNLTTKGPFLFEPDSFIVWNEQLKKELELLHNIPGERVYVAGIPQTDIYWQKEQFATRQQFFANHGLDENLDLITYTTGPPGLVPMDNTVAELLYDQLCMARPQLDWELLVRLHPKDDPVRYEHLTDKPRLTLQLPGRNGTTNDGWNPTNNDMFTLAETLYYSNVVINIASTTTIDAIAFDTPVINVAFDGMCNHPPAKSCRRFYDFDHYKQIVASGGVRIAYTPQKLMHEITRYLEDPTLEHEGRAIIRKQQYGIADGRAGERIAAHILAKLAQTSPRSYPSQTMPQIVSNMVLVHFVFSLISDFLIRCSFQMALFA